jgi:hypothetical protein
MADLKKGDHVTWNAGSEGKHIEGTVQKTITEPMEIKGHHVAASPDNPEVVVKSDKTGAIAAHKPESVHKGTMSKRGA